MFLNRFASSVIMFEESLILFSENLTRVILEKKFVKVRINLL